MDNDLKPGTGKAFKNKFKKENKHPDFTGRYVDPDGVLCDIAFWVYTDKNGEKYLSFKTSEPKSI